MEYEFCGGRVESQLMRRGRVGDELGTSWGRVESNPTKISEGSSVVLCLIKLQFTTERKHLILHIYQLNEEKNNRQCNLFSIIYVDNRTRIVRHCFINENNETETA